MAADIAILFANEIIITIGICAFSLKYIYPLLTGKLEGMAYPTGSHLVLLRVYKKDNLLNASTEYW